MLGGGFTSRWLRWWRTKEKLDLKKSPPDKSGYNCERKNRHWTPSVSPNKTGKKHGMSSSTGGSTQIDFHYCAMGIFGYFQKICDTWDFRARRWNEAWRHNISCAGPSWATATRVSGQGRRQRCGHSASFGQRNVSVGGHAAVSPESGEGNGRIKKLDAMLQKYAPIA